MNNILTENVSVHGEKFSYGKMRGGELYFGEKSCCEMAEKYGTPLYLMDENRIRTNCRTYAAAVKEAFGENGMVIYASKAACFKRIYEIIKEENLGADVVSPGEIYTAQQAGMPMKNVFFQGNNKTDEDIRFAIKAKVGYFVCDNADELDALDRIAGEMGVKQKILLRLTPGIDPHTYAAVATGKVDSKFGTAIETGQAEEITLLALSKENIRLMGFHCHVGSMVFDPSIFVRSARIMLDFITYMKTAHGFITKMLDIGGGFGVRYVDGQPEASIYKDILQIARYIKSICYTHRISHPKIIFEPGRSIVADAGMTLYTVGSVKKITGYKNYVSVDGGMTDNPRYALYQSLYTVVTANKLSPRETIRCDLVGRCCESGDIIQPNVDFPSDIERGDIVAVLTTGAYNYSMASNYNRVPRPPIVMVNGENDYVAVERESMDDLIRNDVSR